MDEFTSLITVDTVKKILELKVVLDNYSDGDVCEYNGVYLLFRQKSALETARVTMGKDYINDRGVEDVEMYHYTIIESPKGDDYIKLYYQPYDGDDKQVAEGGVREVELHETEHFKRALVWFYELNSSIMLMDKLTLDLFNFSDTVFESIHELDDKIHKKLSSPIKFKRNEVEYCGQKFKVIDYVQACTLLNDVRDLESGEPLYDIEAFGFDFADEEYPCFLLAEDDVCMHQLELVPNVEGAEDLYILGFIFLKNLELKSHILAYELEFSPVLIVKGNLIAKNMYFCGSKHYVGGDVSGELLYAFYNHGELHIKGALEVVCITAVDMSCYIGTLKAKSIISDDSVKAFDKLLDENGQVVKMLNTYPSTHRLQDVFIDAVKPNVMWKIAFPDDEDVIQGICAGQSLIDFRKPLNYPEFSQHIESRFSVIFKHKMLAGNKCTYVIEEDEFLSYKYNKFVFKGKTYRDVGLYESRYLYQARVVNCVDDNTYTAYLEYYKDNGDYKCVFQTKLHDNYTSTNAVKLAFCLAEEKILAEIKI